MECYNCGYHLAPDADRCPRCGQRFKPREEQATKPAKRSWLDRLKGALGDKDEDERSE